MRKKISLLLLLVFIPALAYAWGVVGISGGVPSGGSCDDCSGDLKFSWHMENVDLTLGTPCGCVDSGGDITATANASIELSATQKQDGSTSALFNADNEYYSFTVSSGDLITAAEGKVIFYVYIDTFDADESVFSAVGDADDYIEIQMVINSAAIDFYGVYSGAGTIDTLLVDSNRIEDEWIYVEYGWKYGVDGNDHYIKICDADGVSNCVTEEQDDDLGLVDTAFTELRIGTANQDTISCYLDNFTSYATSGY